MKKRVIATILSFTLVFGNAECIFADDTSDSLADQMTTVSIVDVDESETTEETQYSVSLSSYEGGELAFSSGMVMPEQEGESGKEVSGRGLFTAGTELFFDVIPSQGYTLSSLVAYSENDPAQKYDIEMNGQNCSLMMPEDSIVIEAVFEEIQDTQIINVEETNDEFIEDSGIVEKFEQKVPENVIVEDDTEIIEAEEETESQDAFLAESGEVIKSGSCGDNVTWTLTSDSENTDSYLLIISGTGKMNNYDDINYVQNPPWHSYCSSISEVIIENGVTTIGWYAFWECSSLTSIELSDSVTSIGYEAFSGCSSLTSIELPDSMTSIGGSAFSGCSSLTSIEIPASVTSIGRSTFYGCSSLTSIELSDSVTGIGENAFKNCSSLTSIELSNCVTSIGESAFSGCSSLTSIEIPASVTSISQSAFSGCNSLESVELSEGVTSIGTSAFYDCSSLERIEIPTSVTSIGYDAFQNCKNAYIYVPSTVQQIGSNAFSGCKRVFKGTDGYSVEEFNYWCSLDQNVSEIVLPGYINQIPDTAFKENKKLKRIQFTSQINRIGDNAFKNCFNLLEIDIPSSVSYIGKSAFSGCNSLSEVQLPESLSVIESCTFYNCTGLVNVVIPRSVESIDEDAFSGCNRLSNIILPENLKSLGARSFYDCSELTSIELPAGVTSIEGYTFSYCSSLTSIELPSGVKSIEYYAFEGCSNLTNIELPDSLTSIGDDAFYGCSSLARVEIPDSVTSIGYCAFGGCSSLTNIEIPAGVTSIEGYTFSYCSSLTSIEIPDSMTSIGGSAFSGCSNLARIELPDGVTSIGGSAFSGCSNLTRIELPDGVTSIGDSAFSGCWGLISITISDNVTNIGQGAFSPCEVVFFGGSKGQWEHMNGEGAISSTCAVYYDTPNPIFIETLSLECDEIFLNAGEEKELIVSCLPENATHHKYVWSSENSNAVWVEEGVLHTSPYYSGTFSITVIAKDGSGIKTTCLVHLLEEIEKKTNIEVKLEEDVYTGEEVTPSLHIYNYYGEELEEGIDYTVTYDNNINAGIATITITGIGDYSGTITRTYTITPKSLKEVTICEIADVNYTGNEIVPIPELKCGTSILKEGVDYTVSYKNNRNAGTGTVIVTGMGNYTGTITKNFEIKAKELNGITVNDITARTYSGKAIEPALEVKDGTKELKEGVDFTVSFRNNKNVGTGIATISGIGNYKGTKEKVFRINTKDISDTNIGKIDEKQYSGKAIEINPTVKDGIILLEKGEDYTVSYKNNINAGTAVVIITGKGNYSGTIQKTFKILKASNPLNAKAKTVKVKASKLKKKKQTVKAAKAFIISGAQGDVSYKVVKYDKKAKKKIKVSKAGKITVKKGLKKGTYKLKVNVTAAGNANYNAITKTVTLKVKVK